MNHSSEIMLAVRGLGKTVSTAVEKLNLLHDIEFSLPAGASLAIVGSSGSGKSTLLALLAGLDQASRGQITLAGKDLGSLNEDQRAELRGQISGFVFQSFQLLPELSALENTMLPLELAGKKDASTRATEWLERVGLSHRLAHTPRQLSGGEQQRVALARAFASSPKILFADEPTGSLDAATGTAIADLLFQLNTETQTTLVLVTHDEKLAARCGWQLRLSAGTQLEFSKAPSPSTGKTPE
ncbi:ABC transporter ATP-binding protein [Iodobacter ciconiae]|nr:ABC transporter ATP-binding protein [Iodobacter ciconiae]